MIRANRHALWRGRARCLRPAPNAPSSVCHLDSQLRSSHWDLRSRSPRLIPTATPTASSMLRRRWLSTSNENGSDSSARNQKQWNGRERRPQQQSSPSGDASKSLRSQPLTLNEATQKLKSISSLALSKVRPLPSIFDQASAPTTAGTAISSEASSSTSSSLPPLSSSVSAASESLSDADLKQRFQLLVDTNTLFDSLVGSVESGRLNPSGKHGKTLSSFCDIILWIYSTYVPPTAQLQEHGISIHAFCKRVLRTMQDDWNLDLSQTQYNAAIQIALREERWEDASSLFLKQIDPEAGHNPVAIDVNNPMGLYAIAMYHGNKNIDSNPNPNQQQEQQSQYQPQAQHDGDVAEAPITEESTAEAVVPPSTEAAERVLDGVRCLHMVAAQDRRTYLLAAGSALAHANEAQGLLQLWQDNASALADEFSDDIVPAMMLACIQSGDKQQAWSLFQLLSEAISQQEEWQWGGSSDRMDPLLRDLGMRSCGSEFDQSATAVRLFHDALDLDVPISMDAFLGTLAACEQDRNWQDAVLLFVTVLDRLDEGRSVLVPSRMVLASASDSFRASPQDTSRSTQRDELHALTQGIACILHTCNAAYKGGVGMFCLRLLDMQLSRQPQYKNVSSTHATGGLESPLEASLWNSMSKLSDPMSVLLPTMASLCLLRCHEQAFSMYDHLKEKGFVVATEATDEYCETLKQRMARYDRKPVGNSWESASRHMHRFTSMLDVIEANPALIKSPRVRAILYSALASAMRASTVSRQPENALLLYEWVGQALTKDGNSSTLAESIQSILRFSKACRRSNANSTDPTTDVGTSTGPIAFSDLENVDILAAEKINAQRWMTNRRDSSQKIDEVESILVEGTEAVPRAVLSSSIEVLLAKGRADDALQLYISLDGSQKTPGMYVFLAEYFATQEEWNQVMKLYQDAGGWGCASENLASIAMKAVTGAQGVDQLTKLRDIVDDSAKLCGVAPIEWMESRYWHLKKTVGYQLARKLLFWGDKSFHLDELQLAIEEMAKRKKLGLRARNEGVRAIVRSARYFHPRSIPPHHKAIALVPRSSTQWISLICFVLDDIVASASSLRTDRYFLSDLYQALGRLGYGSIDFSANANTNASVQGESDGLDGNASPDAGEKARPKISFEILRQHFNDLHGATTPDGSDE